MPTPTISVVIITKNAERTLERCLRSVEWATETLVVDSGSNDDTLTIAEKLGAKVHTSDWRGFGPQKNLAMRLATSDWILSIDADEFVTPNLAQEIMSVVGDANAHDVYELDRISNYCGRKMLHSGWRPDYVARLFKSGKAEFSQDLVHERLLFKGVPGRLTGKLDHDSFYSPDEVIEKMNRYSTLGAQQLFDAGKQSGVLTPLLHAAGAFLKTYVFRAGFLDGAEGFFLAISNAEGAYYKYVKLYYLNKRQN
jgi:glycosyltransferase involved in cell wall biosynthesis